MGHVFNQVRECPGMSRDKWLENRHVIYCLIFEEPVGATGEYNDGFVDMHLPIVQALRAK